MTKPRPTPAQATAALRHSQIVSAIAQRHLELMYRVRNTYAPKPRDAFFRANPAAIKEGWKSLGTIEELHRQFDAALAGKPKPIRITGVDPDSERCLRCGSPALDTGWECNECGYDNLPHYTETRNGN